MIKISRVAVVGAGAVGGYYGARMLAAGVDVTFLLRSDFDHISKQGWCVESIAGDMLLPDVSCARSSDEIGTVDLVVVAWKTTSNAHYENVIRPLLHEQTMILTLQNGLANVEELARLFGAERIFGGLCFVCINRIGPGHLRHSASGMVRVGEYQSTSGDVVSDRLQLLVDFLCGCEIDAHVVDQLEKAQWMKLVWNIPFNGLTIAEGGVDTEFLLGVSGMEDRIRQIMQEVQAVAAELGYQITDEFIEHQIAVTKPMRAYRPSSMVDYIEGRDVEVDSIWREPVRRAHALGVKVPEIEILLREIEQKLHERAN